MTIYFDNAATTKVRPEILNAINDAEAGLYFNSAALYSGSINSRKAIEGARNTILRRLADSGEGELVFTSGATESNNLVIFGKIHNQKRHHLVVLAGEHSSSYAPSVALKNDGFNVDYIPLKRDGTCDLVALKKIIRPTTTLVVFGMINSDVGALQPTKEIVDIIRQISPKAHIHCDAVQAFCKFDFDVVKLDLDSCSISAHKIYGQKGVGALWLKKGINLKPIMYGGSQQDYRPGTENNAGVIGFARAVELYDTKKSFEHVSALRKRLVKDLTLTTDSQNPYITNIMLPVFGQTVMNALSTKGIYVGLGSACTATASKNRTLIAMGIPENKTKNVLRVSLGIYNTMEEIDKFLHELNAVLDILQ